MDAGTAGQGEYTCETQPGFESGCDGWIIGDVGVRGGYSTGSSDAEDPLVIQVACPERKRPECSDADYCAKNKKKRVF